MRLIFLVATISFLVYLLMTGAPFLVHKLENIRFKTKFFNIADSGSAAGVFFEAPYFVVTKPFRTIGYPYRTVRYTYRTMGYPYRAVRYTHRTIGYPYRTFTTIRSYFANVPSNLVRPIYRIQRIHRVRSPRYIIRSSPRFTYYQPWGNFRIRLFAPSPSGFYNFYNVDLSWLFFFGLFIFLIIMGGFFICSVDLPFFAEPAFYPVIYAQDVTSLQFPESQSSFSF